MTTKFLQQLYNRATARFNKFPATIVQSRHGAIQRKAKNFNKFERQQKQQ
jgi:hypothetical protein